MKVFVFLLQKAMLPLQNSSKGTNCQYNQRNFDIFDAQILCVKTIF